MSAVAGDPATHPGLERFLRSLAARDASPHTIRAYRTAVGTYLDWLAANGVDWTRPRRPELRGYLARLGADASRSTVAQRLAAIRSFHRWAAREGLAAGDPWGAIATPRLPRRLPRVLEVDQVARLLAVVDGELDAAETTRPDRVPLATALALRDRALVETAYAAGLRISELAAADLGRLDLRRGEIRVIGKGRKERIGLLGRPAVHALEAYLDHGRPILLERAAGRDGERADAPPSEVFLTTRADPWGFVAWPGMTKTSSAGRPIVLGLPEAVGHVPAADLGVQDGHERHRLARAVADLEEELGIGGVQQGDAADGYDAANPCQGRGRVVEIERHAQRTPLARRPARRGPLVQRHRPRPPARVAPGAVVVAAAAPVAQRSVNRASSSRYVIAARSPRYGLAVARQRGDDLVAPRSTARLAPRPSRAGARPARRRCRAGGCRR